jgi:hypothetical protein
MDESWAKSNPAQGNGQKGKGDQQSNVRVDTGHQLMDQEISQLLTDCSMPEDFYQSAQAMSRQILLTVVYQKTISFSFREQSAESKLIFVVCLHLQFYTQAVRRANQKECF